MTDTSTTTAAPKVLYTAKTHTVGGRENGVSRSADGNLDVKISLPGSGRPGTNPEQLLAAGWSACLESAISLIARKRHVALPSGPEIDTEIDLRTDESGYSLQARFNISLPGIEKDLARSLVEEGHQICPYSKAMKGNVGVLVTVV